MADEVALAGTLMELGVVKQLEDRAMPDAPLVRAVADRYWACVRARPRIRRCASPRWLPRLPRPRATRSVRVSGREPLVSIGVFVYNGERFLAHQLDSLRGQTLRDFELIISDNASTDRTAEICREYEARDTRVRYIRQPGNIGAPRNWNFVADQARGQYFLGASANDFYDARMLEKCVAALAADPLAVLCYGRTCIVDEDTAERRPFLHDFSVMEARPSERFKTLRRSLVLNNAQMGVMRLDVLRRTGATGSIRTATSC